MDHAVYSTRNGGLTLAQLLDYVENDEDVGGDVYIVPPDDDNETEEDSDKSDEEHEGDVNHLPRGILNNICEVVSSDEDNWDLEDLLPLYMLQKNLPKNKGGDERKSYPHSEWIRNPNVIPVGQMITQCIPKEPSSEAKNASSPVEMFKLFLDDELIKLIIEESNKYALQKNSALNVTTEELFVFLGILLLSGYGRYPNKRMYWSSDEDIPKIIQNSMRLKRFEKILRYFHLNDNTQRDLKDRLYKLRPFIDKLNVNFRTHGGLDEYLSIDESMVPYYGKHFAKQYIRGKPIRFGFKNWALCSSNGFMFGFNIYTGKDATKEKNFGVGGDVVLSLLQQVDVPASQGYKLFFDNYFTSLPLLWHLSKKNYCATGTIRENRLEKCPVDEKKTWNKARRGDYQFFRNDTSLLVQWKDNKVVSIVSNFEKNDVVSTTRWDRVSKSKKSVPQPKMISNYNKGMGGVDKMDALVAAYRTRIRQRKWYWPLVVYLLDVSVVNSWLLMRKLKPNSPDIAALLPFRRYIALSFLKSFGIKPQPGRIFNTCSIRDVRYDNLGQIIIYNETDRRFGHCGKKSKFICEKCNIALHPKICFKSYHTN